MAIQRAARGMLAQRALERRRAQLVRRLTVLCERSTSRLLDDVGCYKGFLQDEGRNWRAFGLIPPAGTPYVGVNLTPEAGTGDTKGKAVGKKGNKGAVRSIDTCCGIISGPATTRLSSSDDNLSLLCACLSTMQLPEPPPGTVWPTQDLSVSSYVALPSPWDVHSASSLNLQESSVEKGAGTVDEKEKEKEKEKEGEAVGERLPSLYGRIARDVKLF